MAPPQPFPAQVEPKLGTPSPPIAELPMKRELLTLNMPPLQIAPPEPVVPGPTLLVPTARFLIKIASPTNNIPMLKIAPPDPAVAPGKGQPEPNLPKFVPDAILLEKTH